jgi:hypothetical protein
MPQDTRPDPIHLCPRPALQVRVAVHEGSQRLRETPKAMPNPPPPPSTLYIVRLRRNEGFAVPAMSQRRWKPDVGARSSVLEAPPYRSAAPIVGAKPRRRCASSKKLRLHRGRCIPSTREACCLHALHWNCAAGNTRLRGVRFSTRLSARRSDLTSREERSKRSRIDR